MSKSLIIFCASKLHEQIYIHLKEEIKTYLMNPKSNELNHWLLSNYVQYVYWILSKFDH